MPINLNNSILYLIHMIFFSESNTDLFIAPSINVLPDSYLCCALSPNIPHEELVNEYLFNN